VLGRIHAPPNYSSDCPPVPHAGPFLLLFCKTIRIHVLGASPPVPWLFRHTHSSGYSETCIAPPTFIPFRSACFGPFYSTQMSSASVTGPDTPALGSQGTGIFRDERVQQLKMIMMDMSETTLRQLEVLANQEASAADDQTDATKRLFYKSGVQSIPRWNDQTLVQEIAVCKARYPSFADVYWHSFKMYAREMHKSEKRQKIVVKLPLVKDFYRGFFDRLVASSEVQSPQFLHGMTIAEKNPLIEDALRNTFFLLAATHIRKANLDDDTDKVIVLSPRRVPVQTPAPTPAMTPVPVGPVVAQTPTAMGPPTPAVTVGTPVLTAQTPAAPVPTSTPKATPAVKTFLPTPVATAGAGAQEASTETKGAQTPSVSPTNPVLMARTPATLPSGKPVAATTKDSAAATAAAAAAPARAPSVSPPPVAQANAAPPQDYKASASVVDEATSSSLANREPMPFVAIPAVQPKDSSSLQAVAGAPSAGPALNPLLLLEHGAQTPSAARLPQPFMSAAAVQASKAASALEKDLPPPSGSRPRPSARMPPPASITKVVRTPGPGAPAAATPAVAPGVVTLLPITPQVPAGRVVDLPNTPVVVPAVPAVPLAPVAAAAATSTPSA
jgi:hypothetical protein